MFKLYIILALSLGFTSCGTTQISNSIPISNTIILNHFLVVVDSSTYQEILKSKIFNTNFAYSQEKKLQGYRGIYIIGQNNYIEIFNPNSMEGQVIQAGESWICHASLKANHLESLDITENQMLQYSSDNNFDELSLYFNDSTNLFSTREINKDFYESWCKKTFNDSVTFLPEDYNSPAESDSSKNYLFKDVAGIRVSIANSDSANVVDYLTLIGYTKVRSVNSALRFSNSIDFVELNFAENIEIPTVTTIFMNLRGDNKTERIQIGNTELIIEGKKARLEMSKE